MEDRPTALEAERDEQEPCPWCDPMDDELLHQNGGRCTCARFCGHADCGASEE